MQTCKGEKVESLLQNQRSMWWLGGKSCSKIRREVIAGALYIRSTHDVVPTSRGNNAKF